MTSTSRPPSSSERPRLILVALWLSVFTTACQVMIIAPILPRITTQLGADPARAGSLITAYAAAVAIFALVAGPVSDRVGRRRILLVGTVVMTAALAAHGLATSFGALLALRALAGVAGGILSGAAVAYVGDYFPRERRGWANGWILTGWAAGQIAGIPLGTLLADAVSFRAPFLAFAVLGAVAVWLVAAFVPQPAVGRATTPLTLAGAASDYASLLRRKAVLAATGVYLLMFLGVALYVIFLPSWLEARHGFDGAAIATLYFIGGIANVLVGPRAGKLSDRIGRKPIIVYTSIGIVALMLLTPPAATTSWGIYAVFFVLMALFASRGSPFQALLTELVPASERGSLMSLTMAVGQLGFGLGGALAGASFDGQSFQGNAMWAAATVALAGVVVWLFVPETRGAADEATPHVLPELARLQSQGALCGPCPEAGHFAEAICKKASFS